MDRVYSHRTCKHVSGQANALRHVGSAISHASPSAGQSNRISPFSCPRIMLSITRVPKPRRVGGLTGGPPVSVQRRTSRPSSVRDHATRTLPSGVDKPPYLAALVASSCRVTAIAWATFGSSKTFGHVAFSVLGVGHKLVLDQTLNLGSRPARFHEQP